MSKKIKTSELDYTRISIQTTTITIVVGGTYTLEELKGLVNKLEETLIPVMHVGLAWNHKIIEGIDDD